MTIQTISPSPQAGGLSVIAAVLLLIAWGLFASSPLVAQTRSPYDKTTLIKGLKQSAIDQQLSSADFVRLIEQRGVAFQMNARDEAELRLAGASNEVIAAISRNYRHVPKSLPKGTGSLTIRATIPECRVFVNGFARGTTDVNGALTLPPLKAGQYKVTLRKENYEDQERAIVIASGVESTENFVLTAVKGRLTVKPSIADAQVRLNGVEYQSGIQDLSLAAETYELKVSRRGFRTFTKTVTVSPRGSVTIEAPLEPIPIEEALTQAVSHMEAKRFAEAAASGREILATHPDNAKAHLLVGLAYYYSGQYSNSVEFLTKGMTLGEQVTLLVKHHHAVFLGDDLCTGRITIGLGRLAFSSIDKGGHDFSVPAAKIYELTPEPRKAGRVHVRVGIQNGAKEDKKSYNFQVTQTYLIQANPTSSQKFIRCNNCEDQTLALYQLLRQLKDVPFQPPIASRSNGGGTDAPVLKRDQLSADEGAPGRPTLTRRPSTSSNDGTVAGSGTVAPPSAVLHFYNNPGKYRIAVPDNWKEIGNSSRSMTLAPAGASTTVDSRSYFSHGVVVGTHPSQGKPLPQVFEQFINLILKSSPYLQQTVATKAADIKGRAALAAPLKGKSPVSQQDEFAVVYAVLLKNGDMLYIIAVSPQDEVTAYSATFGRIIASLEFLD